MLIVGAAAAAIPLLALTSVGTASATAAHPAVHAAVLAPPPCASGSGAITDNSTHGYQIKGEGVGNEVQMVSSGGNCFTPINGETVDGLSAHEYENGAGNCLYVSGNGTGDVTLSSNCSASDQFEQLVADPTTDISGYRGNSLFCGTNSCLNLGAGSQLCAAGTNQGSPIDVENNFDNGANPDRCTWALP